MGDTLGRNKCPSNGLKMLKGMCVKKSINWETGLSFTITLQHFISFSSCVPLP